MSAGVERNPGCGGPPGPRRAPPLALLRIATVFTGSAGIGHSQIRLTVVMGIAEHCYSAAPVLRYKKITVWRPLHPTDTRQTFRIDTHTETGRSFQLNVRRLENRLAEIWGSQSRRRQIVGPRRTLGQESNCKPCNAQTSQTVTTNRHCGDITTGDEWRAREEGERNCSLFNVQLSFVRMRFARSFGRYARSATSEYNELTLNNEQFLSPNCRVGRQ